MPDTPREYWESVDDIAKEAKAEYPDPDDDRRNDYISESVDGSHWIIYHHANEIVLETSPHEPDPRDVKAMSPSDADWRKLRAIAAYMAMEADVHVQLHELDENESEDGESNRLNALCKYFPYDHP